MKVLVCNAGSTSLKFKLFDMPGDHVLAEGKVERVGSADNAIFHYKNCQNGFSLMLEKQDISSYAVGIRRYLDCLLDKENGLLSTLSQLERIGFKTVLAKDHLGIHELTPEVIAAMETYMVIAPSHNRPYVDAIRQFQALVPHAKMVGAFETAFHTTIPLERKLYGIPYEWYETYGIQRFGYHGASHSYISETVAEQHGSTGRLISCHLGGSGSVCAIQNGESVDTSFGFSLQTGTLHANRAGDLDPYIMPFLESQGMSKDDVLYGIEKNGGLLGLSGVSNDLRDVEIAAHDGNQRAKLAIDAFCNGIIKYIGAFYAELGGLDHLVFTGGIGENSSSVRQTVCHALSHLGVLIDNEKNKNRPDRVSNWMISVPDSTVQIQIIPANEELGVARKTYQYR